MWALAAALLGWLHGALAPWLRAALFASAVALLFPPQTPLFGVSGYLITALGALAVGAIYVSRSRAKSRLATA